MPNVSSATDITKDTTGYSDLKWQGKVRRLRFTATSTGASLGAGNTNVKVTNDGSKQNTVVGGLVTVIPTTLIVNEPYDITVTPGTSPDFNLEVDTIIDDTHIG